MSYLLVKRKKENPSNLIFKDSIHLISDEFDNFQPNKSGLYYQKCDSEADEYITKGRKWSKAGGDTRAYTIAPGVYLLKKATYKKGPGIIIKNPVTILGFVKFTLNHMVHRTSLPVTGIAALSPAKDGNKYKLGYSGGCIVLPALQYDILDEIENLIGQDKITYPTHIKIVEM